ncbi:MAG: DUF255 domain-containing protein [Roseibacillus sp.]
MQNLKVLFLLLILCSLTACRTKNEDGEQKVQENTEFFSTPPENIPELGINRLATEPSNFLRNQSTSPIHWQPWTPEILDLAERSQRLIFVFVGSTTHSKSQSLAQLLESKFTTEINEKYVPVLADTELDPALALACNMLSNERRESIAFPFLMWLSHEGNPVAWIPVSSVDEENLLLGFRRAQNTVEAILEKSSRYVIENSRYDNEGRRGRIKSSLSLGEKEGSKQVARNDLFITAQSLSDLYDSIDKTFDNTGGIPPGNLITSLARISAHPAAPSRLRKDARKASKESIDLLVKSAIRDPLDGYFFTRRNSRSFSVPALSKTLKTQAEMLSAMSSSPSTPASKRAIAYMLEALEQNPIQSTALYPGETNELAYFWSTSAVEDLLSKDEMAVAKAAFGLKGLGNVPSSDDPRRLYFRRNTLGLALFGSDLAQKVGKNEPEVEKLLASAIEKISARRNEILTTSNALLTEELPILAPKARLLTSLVRAHAASPSPSTLQSLNRLGEEILTEFVDSEGRLIRVPARGDLRTVQAFANDYAVTIEALLEWYRVTWREQLLEVSLNLTTILLDDFLDKENYLVEANIENHPLTFPVYSKDMIFGPSTWGIAHGVLRKMSNMGHQHPKLASAIEAQTPLLEAGLKRAPVVHTDYLLAGLNNLGGYVLVVAEAQKGNQSLRLALAQPEFDSINTILQNSILKDLPSAGNNAAVLLKNGEKIKTFASTDAILTGLRSQLAR